MAKFEKCDICGDRLKDKNNPLCSECGEKSRGIVENNEEIREINLEIRDRRKELLEEDEKLNNLKDDLLEKLREEILED